MGGDSRSTTPNPASSYHKLATRPKGKQIHSIYKDRLRQFTDGGQYRGQGLLPKIEEARVSGDPHIKLEVYSPPDQSRPSFKDATSHEFKPTRKGESFGPSWTTHWFRVHLKVPSELRDKNHLELHWDAGNEGLVWSEKGDPIQGLTGNGERVEWVLPESFRDGKTHVFYVEMACNAMFGNAPGGDSIQPPNENRYFQLHTADIVAIDMEARQLYIDFWIIGDAAREFPEDSWEQHEALQICNEIMDAFIAGNGSHDSIVAGRKIAQKYIGNVNSSKVYDNDNTAIVNAIGNCHIDTCWLWPFAETKRKVVRSWMNQCDLLERYPEHRFVASQAQQWKWLEKIYPSAFDRVKAKVKEGTFQPIGGSWVEHDTNMPGGESLVRQFLYGQRYFESRFGERCQTFWLPDTFGYSTQLPQLCRLAGMTRFFTQKLSWNNINNFPHTTFNWVALDGSQVLCHMAPCETYTADAHFGDVSRSVTQHKSLDQDNTSLLPFGKGDGGGGPTWSQIEKLRRSRGMADTTGRLPRVRIANTVDEFFAGLEKKQQTNPFTNWYGELYFELHRGTYTTQANNKYNNRHSEILLHDVEYFATFASIQDTVKGTKTGYKYPKKEIDEMWENVLLCQFHDCLPGSCIEMCYDDSDEIYAKVFETGKKLLDDALSALGFDKDTKDTPAYTLDTLGWSRRGISRAIDAQGSEHFVDRWYGNPIMAIEPEDDSFQGVKIQEKGDNVFVMSNTIFDVEISNGVITSIYDHRVKREVLPKGAKANQLVVFDDKPLYWQAWDVEVYHLESRKELHATSKSYISHMSATRASLTTTTKISDKSSITTTVTLHNGRSDGTEQCASSYIETVAEVDWHETMKFLKVEFPTSLRSQNATYETQFGLIQRPTHYNTSWDMAKFEVCCHKFADLSESNYGVTILNDSKYGFATTGSLMRLSLLRSPKAPDAHADMGHHKIRWAIMPHPGPLGAASVKAGFEFNFPTHVRGHENIASVAGLLNDSFRLYPNSPADEGLVLDGIKRAEDDADVAPRSGLADDSGHTGLKVRKGKSVILRIYDSLGGRARGKVVFGDVKVKGVWRCNLLEDDEEQLKVEKDSVAIEVRAFEVLSLRVELA
ncbi:glycoside hydrolase family 38 protein [Myriangium duriaei CBS 260.36]|uniref:Alpha-mannosidase n=1 Tax=Myriangium duriaei CBS 260.36 TaxID=1168546 RepID=A0A9P4J1S5_9PEZI|nr:glycoside hydrolase family 38 protein [Myriangium duriaei CBS 260.36]